MSRTSAKEGESKEERRARTFLRSTFGHTLVPSSRILGSTFFGGVASSAGYFGAGSPILRSLICLTSHLDDSPPRVCRRDFRPWFTPAKSQTSTLPTVQRMSEREGLGPVRLTLSPPCWLAAWYVSRPPSCSLSRSSFLRSSGSVSAGLASCFSIAWNRRIKVV